MMMTISKRTVLLMLSLVLNAALGGYVVSNIIHQSPRDIIPPHGKGPMERALDSIETLSPEKHAKILDLLKKNMDSIRLRHEKEEILLDDLHKALTADYLDEPALNRIFQKLHDEKQGMKKFDAMLIEIAKTLSDEERKQFFEAAKPPKEGAGNQMPCGPRMPHSGTDMAPPPPPPED